MSIFSTGIGEIWTSYTFQHPWAKKFGVHGVRIILKTENMYRILIYHDRRVVCSLYSFPVGCLLDGTNMMLVPMMALSNYGKMKVHLQRI